VAENIIKHIFTGTRPIPIGIIPEQTQFSQVNYQQRKTMTASFPVKPLCLQSKAQESKMYKKN